MSHLSVSKSFCEPLFKYKNAVFNGMQEKESFILFILTFNTLFTLSTDIQRVGEGHPSAYLTSTSKMFVAIFDCHTCTFHAPLIHFWTSTVVHNQEGAIPEVAKWALFV